MSQTIDKTYLVNNIQLILNKVHTHPQKLKINANKHDRISFACPICGDSHKDPSQKRGHLFLNNLYYKCYNEDCRSTFTNLCKRFNVKIDSTMRMELINYIDTQFHLYKKEENDWFISNFDKLIKFDDLQNWFDSGKGPVKNFRKVSFGSATYMYLLNRGIPKELITELFYEGIRVTGKFSEPYLIILNKMEDKVIGMQERNLKSGPNRRFRVWSFKDLYEHVYEQDLDLIESISYNKLGYLFNILNINFEKTITLFEGYTDSIFFPNSVGAVGLNSDYGIFTQNDLDVRFFFDNDDVGKRKSHEWLKKGFNVFLWEKYINTLAKKQDDPHAFKIWFNKNIKDLNKLMQELPTNWKDLEPYFSSNPFDTLYLNYAKYNKNKKTTVDKNIHNYEWKL